MNYTNDQLLAFELHKQLKATYPSKSPEAIVKILADIVQTGAYQHDGTRVVPVGAQGAMSAASRIAPELCHAITAEHVKACSNSSSLESAPYDRAQARLRAMGIDLDQSLGGEDNLLRGDFMGVDLSTIEPKGAA